jgi:hypothetical protein
MRKSRQSRCTAAILTIAVAAASKRLQPSPNLSSAVPGAGSPGSGRTFAHILGGTGFKQDLPDA